MLPRDVPAGSAATSELPEACLRPSQLNGYSDEFQNKGSVRRIDA
jgi:hypothetical protein